MRILKVDKTIRVVTLFFILVSLTQCESSASVTASTEQPNIVYILADDLGYGDLSSFGQKKFATPHIDSIASQGMRFTRHYSGATVCAPSRCALLTGLHTGHTQVRGNREIDPVGQAPIRKDTVTFAKLLKKSGYETGAFGKWGLGFPGSGGDPLNQGFDTFFGWNCQRNAHNYYPKRLYHDRKKVVLDGKTYAHDLVMEKATAFIKATANKGKPFFCFLPVAIPHAAMHAPKDKHEAWRKKFPQFDKKIGHYAGPKVVNPIAGFAAMVTHLDDQVGELLTLIKELGIDDNTLVIFTSDNGPHLEGGHDPVFFNSNGPLRGFKRDLFEGGIRVPMMVRWPGKVKAGSHSDLHCAFWDIMPTFVELVGEKTPSGIDGVSILPTLLGKGQQKIHDYLYWEFHEQGGKQAILKGDWKAIKLGVSKNRNAPIKLFNIKNDIGEKNNVASKNPKIIAEMKAIFAKVRTTNPNFKLFDN